MVGTSLQGHVTATFSELVEAFGLPTFSEPSGDGKVNTEWQLMLGTDAVPATIYDWKDFDGGRRSRDGQSYDWHIGGKSRMAVIAVMEKLNAYRINA